MSDENAKAIKRGFEAANRRTSRRPPQSLYGSIDAPP
jgi:hypothetical protein